MTDNILTNKQIVTLSSQYMVDFPKFNLDGEFVNYASEYYGRYRVLRRHADNTYTLRGNGLTVLNVQRQYIIVERGS